jgi:hypothetical protein
LLDAQVQYTSGQEVEVEFSNLGWVPGHFNRYALRPGEVARRVSVEALGSTYALFVERVRPAPRAGRRP